MPQLTQEIPGCTLWSQTLLLSTVLNSDGARKLATRHGPEQRSHSASLQLQIWVVRFPHWETNVRGLPALVEPHLLLHELRGQDVFAWASVSKNTQKRRIHLYSIFSLFPSISWRKTNKSLLSRLSSSPAFHLVALIDCVWNISGTVFYERVSVIDGSSQKVWCLVAHSAADTWLLERRNLIKDAYQKTLGDRAWSVTEFPAFVFCVHSCSWPCCARANCHWAI